MLFGTLIFIKKSGGDGSRFPVTNKSLKIGRSDDCIIRIQNPLISPEHCQLTVDDNGQAKIRNLSSTNPTVLNDKPLGNGEFILHQGDVFKLGERYARWEYQPSSKYYHEPSISSQRLIAVVPPQERVSVKSEGSSSNFNQGLRRFSEGVTIPGKESVKKTRLSLCVTKGIPNKKKTDRHSLRLKRLPFSPQIKLRKSTNLESSGTPNSGSGNKTPLRRSSIWKVNTVTPEKEKSPQKIGTNRKSTPIKMPMTHLLNDGLIKSTIKSASKIPNLLTIAETSSPVSKVSATRSLDEVLENLNMSPKSPMKLAKTPTPKKIKRTSLRKSLSKSNKNKSFSRSMLMDEVQVMSHSGDGPETTRDLWKFTPSGKTTLRKSMLNKAVLQGDLEPMNSSDEKGTPKKEATYSETKKIDLHAVVEISILDDEHVVLKNESPKTSKQTPIKSERKLISEQSKSSHLSPSKYGERLSRGKKSIPSGVLSTPREKESVKVSPRTKPAASRKSLGVTSNKTSQSRGTKRKFSAVASAERAAKKLKTIAPTKPDKNKKAALLVLGKASRKLKALQNTNVVIKQKIVKKAIKQSTKSRKRAKPVKKASPKKSVSPQKEAIQDNKKSPISSPKASISSRRHSTPIGRTSKETTPSKKVETRSKGKADTAGRHSSKSPISPVLSETASIEILNASVPSKASDVKNVTVSPNSGNTSFQYNSQILYDASRRASKRLSTQNFSNRPEFTELSPTALGLTPKSVVEVFKTPKPTNRRSSSFVTPRNKASPGIIKSASTSKIYRKSVRFSNKDFIDSSFMDMNCSSGMTFDFDEIRTPNVTIDRFISPLSNQKTPKVQLKSPSSIVNSIQMDILSMQSKESPTKWGNAGRSPSRSLKSTISLETSPARETKSPKTSEEVKKNQKPQKSPTNDLTDVKGVRQLMKTPRQQKSPKNDLTDVKGVRQLMKTPRQQKSPKNDLTDVKGVRQLMKTPRQQKSPKNDLTDVKGVRQLMKTPRQQKSPKNDLTDVKGVRQLMKTPRQQKSPKNDLTDVRGVRRLMKSPKQQKSPKNDLTDVRGVKRLMDPPKPQKSPKNDLTDVKGVRRLMESPRPRKSPRDDLTDVTGVKQLLITKSPNNDLTNVSGLDTLFQSPPNKIQCLRTLYNPSSKSRKNDLTVAGVRQLFSVNKENNDLNVSFTGVAELFMSPKKRTRNTETISPVSLSGVTESTDNKPALRRTARSVTKIVRESPEKRKSRATAVESPIKSDEESPQVVRRATRSTRAAKAGKSMEVKRSRTKSEREVVDAEEDDKAIEGTNTGRSTRATRKQKLVEASKSPTPVKRTRKVTLVEDKVSTPAKTSVASKAKKQPTKDTSPGSKPSPIRTRRKSMARQSPKIEKRSTRGKTKTTEVTVVSPVRTRQRKAKEGSSADKKTMSSPVRTRRKAK